MKVLFVGLYKTGTKTMNEALGILGYRVSDTERNYTELWDDWWKFFDGKGTCDDIRRMFKDYDAAGDSPACLYWKKILEAYPDIKVILTVRDIESWLDSFKRQVKEINDSDLSFPLSVFSWKARKWFDFIHRAAAVSVKYPVHEFRIVKTFPMYDDDILREFITEHNQDVLENAPKDRLLVYNVKEGWEPLCRFLGHEVPNVPFPHMNKGATIISWRLKNNANMQKMYKEMYFNIALLILVISFALALLLFVKFSLRDT